MKSVCLAIVLSVGTVDRIEEDMVTAEITDKDNKIHHLEMTTAEFPCEIREQEKFYIIYNGKTADIICMQPEPAGADKKKI